MENDDKIELAESLIRDSKIKTGQIYRHFRTKELYVVICLAVDEATLVPVVVYRSNEKGTIFVRSLSSWSELVDRNTEYVLPDGSRQWGRKRFTRVVYSE